MRRNDEREARLGWSSRLSLRQRILAVNIFAIAILAGGLFYLDSLRARLTEARVERARSEATMVAHALAAAPRQTWPAMLDRLGRDSGTRLRVFARDGALLGDNWTSGPPTYLMRDPTGEPWYRTVARWLDNGVDAIVAASSTPPLGDDVSRVDAWPEIAAARRANGPVSDIRRASEGTAFISTAIPLTGNAETLLLTVNARDVRRQVRAERFSLAFALLATLVLAILLSRFLARTIANPLRRLAKAAHSVRLGRAREVDVPLLPERRDEIGLLARALHDMTQSLRQRIDATEAFAADVTHELKNPLASLRSAVDSLDRIEDPALRCQLLDVVRQDVGRLDRLVVDIAEASRLDAELSRARFEPIDLASFIESLLPTWEARRENVSIAFARPRLGSAVVQGEESRLARLLDNLVDNAISFSPEGGLVEVRACADGDEVMISIEDEGTGVPEDSREVIFNRFHSIRPEADFGRHSGLGLAIARAIVEGHGGRIEVGDRRDGQAGARFVVRLPGAAT
ncbi:ATP-binding protein [Sphingosinicella sp.]|uniref:ATP-binding protein n=1 Tax=Sphingosinicella sp. TaxID=1917971 RepID=UPI00403835BA